MTVKCSACNKLLGDEIPELVISDLIKISETNKYNNDDAHIHIINTSSGIRLICRAKSRFTSLIDADGDRVFDIIEFVENADDIKLCEVCGFICEEGPSALYKRSWKCHNCGLKFYDRSEVNPAAIKKDRSDRTAKNRLKMV